MVNLSDIFLSESSSTSYFCTVCEEPASKYLYYGGRVCLGCRAFFRRIRNSKRFKQLTCRGVVPGACVLKGPRAHRRACQACRYHRCLEAGMKPELISFEKRQNSYKHKFCLSHPSAFYPDTLVTKDDEKIIESIVGKVAL